MAKVAQFKLDTSGLDKLLKNAGQKTDTFVIHDGVEYGVHQEFGKRGHPSLLPAFEKHTRRIGEAIGAAVEQGVSLNDVLALVAFNIQRDWASDVNVDTGAYKNSITVSRG